LKIRFFKSEHYVKRGRGDTNLWKLFLERVLSIVSENGSFGLVIPSSIVTDLGGQQLREALFKKRIRGMFEFENRKGIFDIHRSYKFVLLVADNSNPLETFPAAFYLHDIDALKGKTEQEKFVEIPIEFIKTCAPDSLSIPEPRNKQELDIIIEMYQSHALIGDNRKGWSISLIRELDFPKDSDLLKTDGKGWPLFDGKNIHQFIPNFEKVWFNVDPESGIDRVKKHREFKSISREIHERARLVVRRITCSTNVRTVIAAVIPPHSFSATNAPLVLPLVKGKIELDLGYNQRIAYLAGLFNSMVFDFLLRRRIPFTLNFFYIYQTPVPAILYSDKAKEIAKISARLSAVDERFADFASAVGVNFGPLTMKEQLELSAKLNAIVAKLYGLSRKELEVILQSFESFEEDKELVNIKEVKWNDRFIRKFNGEVRKRVLPFFDELNSENVGESE